MEEYIYNSSNGLWYELQLLSAVSGRPEERSTHHWHLGQEALELHQGVLPSTV